MTPLDLFLYVLAAVGGFLAAPALAVLFVGIVAAIVIGLVLLCFWLGSLRG